MTAVFVCTVSANQGNELIYEIEFSQEDLSFDKINNYDTVDLPGCILLREVSKPQLPFKVVHFAIDSDKEVSHIEIIEDISEDVSGEFIIYPAQKSTRYSGAYKFTAPDLSVYNSSVGYPQERVQLQAKGSLSGINIATLHIYPIEYVPIEKTLILHERLRFRLVLKNKIVSSVFSNMRIGAVEPLNNRSYKGNAIIRDMIKKVVANPVDVEEKFERAMGVATSSSGGGDVVDYLIITSEEVKSSGVFLPLIDSKDRRGLSVMIESVETIEETTVGRDIPEKIRNFIIDKHTNNGLVWVLLGGDTNIVPTRLVTGELEGGGIPCDMYYSDLTRDWDADADGIFGELEDNLDLYPDVFVGRAPAENEEEAGVFVNKVLTYESNAPLYAKKALFLGTYDFDDAGGRTKDFIAHAYMPQEFDITKYYERDIDGYRKQTIAAINQGYHLINHIDHADVGKLRTGSNFIDISDIDGLTNKSTPSIIWSCGCLPAAIDHDCIAEHWITNPSGGGVAFVGNSRYGLNPESDKMLDPEFYKSLFIEGFIHVGQTLADSKIAFIGLAKSGEAMRYAMFELNLLGDPEMTIQIIPKMITPAPFSTLTTSTITFEWSPGVNAEEYSLDVGTEPGSLDIFSSSIGTNTSVIVNDIPDQDVNVYVRLWSQIKDHEIFNDYTYQTLNSPSQMISPKPDSTLTSKTATFEWTSSSGIEEYRLDVGTELGNADIFSFSTGTSTSTTVSDIPFNGTTLYVRLSSKINGDWVFYDYTYQTIKVLAEIINPDPRLPLMYSPVTFEWTNIKDAEEYRLDVGTTPGGVDIFSLLTTETSAIVSDILLNGNPVYVRLWSKVSDEWLFDDYILETFDEPPRITDPVPGSIIKSSPVIFEWSAGNDVEEYGLDVGTVPDGQDIFYSRGIDSPVTVANVPLNGYQIYVRLWFKRDGEWFFSDYSYQTKSDRAVITSPIPGSVLPPSLVNFHWTLGEFGERYKLAIGTTQGGNELFSYENDWPANFVFVDDVIPIDGSTIYVRLWTITTAGDELYNDYTYFTMKPAEITNPPPRSTLTSSTVTFQWTTGIGTQPYYILEVGTTMGKDDICNKYVEETSVVVDDIPLTGDPIYVRLKSVVDGGWVSMDYSYETLKPLYGDVNLDKIVNILDLTALERLIAEIDPITPLNQKAGDVSGDGTLSALDLDLIMQYLVQLIDKFPVEGGQLPAGSVNGIGTTDIEAEVGQSIEIPLKAVGFEDVLGMDMEIEYDNNVLEFKGIDGVGIGLSTEVKWYEGNPGDVKVIVQTPVGGGISGTGDVAVIRFDVKEQIGPTNNQVEIKNIDAHEIVLEDIFSTVEISLSQPKARSWIWPPRKARKGQRVFFYGQGYDPGGGRIVEYSWRSSRDGKLSDSRFFVTNSLSMGRHTIYFKVKNDKGVWSEEVRRSIIIQ